MWLRNRTMHNVLGLPPTTREIFILQKGTNTPQQIINTEPVNTEKKASQTELPTNQHAAETKTEDAGANARYITPMTNSGGKILLWR
jgi:hypothetical protein